MPDKSRYRVVEYVGGRILQARELIKQQQIARAVDDDNVPAAFQLNALYRDGATLNVTPSIVGKTVTLLPTDPARPMLVFVREQWEIIKPGEAPAVTLDPGSTPPQTNIFLNYLVNLVDNTLDATLIDQTTGDPAAEMGELVLAVSNTDTSGLSLSGAELEKNTSPIVLFNFLHTSSSLTLVPLDNANLQAYGSDLNAGLVKLTTPTAVGVACSTDDPRLSNSRAPSPGSVIDASVRTPVQDGILVNGDGTPRYDLNTDPGGISAAKLVYQAGTQLVSDALGWIKTQVSSILATLASHVNQPLGTVATHPIPTAAQVGAAPASHVGLPLGLATSHPALVNTNSGGYRLVRDSTVTAIAADPAYGVFNDATEVAALTHDGDVFSLLADALTATPLVEGGDPTLASGSLGLLSILAAVVSQHVNKYPHKNPHGLAPEDIGAATVAYVDTGDLNTYNNAVAYTNAQVPHLSVRHVAVGNDVMGGAYLILDFAPNGGAAHSFAFGMGNYNATPGASAGVPIPAGFNRTQTLMRAAIESAGLSGPGSIDSINLTYNNLILSANVTREGIAYNCQVAWFAICWL